MHYPTGLNTGLVILLTDRVKAWPGTIAKGFPFHWKSEELFGGVSQKVDQQEVMEGIVSVLWNANQMEKPRSSTLFIDLTMKQL